MTVFVTYGACDSTEGIHDMFNSRFSRLGAGALLALVLATPAVAVAVPAGAAPATARGPAVVAAAPTLTATTVHTGLEVPWDIGFLPTGKMLVTERPGQIRVYASGAPGASLERTVSIPRIQVGVTGEAGLMGIAVDTSFATHPYVYVCASREYSGSGGWVNQVLRYTVRASGEWVGPKVLLGGMVANRIHNGCSLEMDASGHLFVGMGDGGTESRAQDRTSLNGKILRMTRSGGTPADNPVIHGTQDLVYTMGHRNPQGIAFQPGTDRVYAVEHGPAVDDEVNLLHPGRNYGWPCVTGPNTPFHGDVAGCVVGDTYEPSAWASGDRTIATSGATFLRGAQWGDLEGDLVVSVLKDQEVRVFDVALDGSLGVPDTRYEGTFKRLRGAVSGPGGQLYLTTSNGSDQVVRVSPGQPVLSRAQGPDRYAVAARVSATTYPDGAAGVIVATGGVYPDALAGSAAGGRLGMPVLLTRADDVPYSTRAELERLQPEQIWVLGGTASVSEQVFAEIATHASVGAQRIDGADRYGVAAAVAERFSAGEAPTVFIASGEVFSDALSGAPAAALEDAPLLLVNSAGIPSSTGEALKSLAPERVYVLGGRSTIPTSVVQGLRHYTSAVIERLDGRDRYAVSRAVSARFWTTAPVFVASGETFPDGLTGGAAAGHLGAALLLSRAHDLPSDTGQAILELAPSSVSLVGGPVSLDPRVEATVGRVVGTR